MTQLTLQNTDSILKEIKDAFFDIPFSNTKFQTEMFVIAAQITPARAYKTIGMQLLVLIESVKSKIYDQEIDNIKVEQLKEEINSGNLNKYDKRIKEIELERKQNEIHSHNKYLNDALHEMNVLYSHLQKFPKYTREEFEAQEYLYFEQSLQRQILGLTGAKEALINMIDDKKTIEQFEKMYAELPHDKKKEMLNDITRQSLAGYIKFDQSKLPK
jgi:hypothetical protein